MSVKLSPGQASIARSLLRPPEALKAFLYAHSLSCNDVWADDETLRKAFEEYDNAHAVALKSDLQLAVFALRHVNKQGVRPDPEFDACIKRLTEAVE